MSAARYVNVSSESVNCDLHKFHLLHFLKSHLKMSVLQKSEEGFIISHEKYIEKTYKNVYDDKQFSSDYTLQHSLFQINTPFKMNSQNVKLTDDVQNKNCSSTRRKRRRIVIEAEVIVIRDHYAKIYDEAKSRGIFMEAPSQFDIHNNNAEAQETASRFYHSSMFPELTVLYGHNDADTGLITWLEKEPYVIPPRCRFFSYDVRDMENRIKLLEPTYDLILLDPPWWNKYIRRKKARCKSSSYEMMYSNEFTTIPINKLASPDTLVVVWCTNCEMHFNCLCNEIFPAWGLEYISKWFWVKVTRSGEPVCKFSEPPRKQPYEQIIFAKSANRSSKLKVPEDNKVIISVPSAIHSHKPPLAEVLADYLPDKPSCLEIFARYLLSDWTSWGLEVLKLQHLSLFKKLPTHDQI